MKDLITFRTVIFYVLCGTIGYFLASNIAAIINRDPPIEYVGAEVAEPEVEAGKTLTVLLTIERHRSCRTLRVQRFITDHAGTKHEVTATAVAQMRPGLVTYDRSVLVPDFAAPGQASYTVRLEFACSWAQVLFHPIVVQSPPVKFDIRPKVTVYP